MGTMTYARDRQVGRIVKAFLGYSGGSQRELARAIGIEESALSRSISGSRRWNLDELDQIAEHFGVTTSVLLEDPENRPDPRTLGVRASRCTPEPWQRTA